jgi:hypothetical protein
MDDGMMLDFRSPCDRYSLVFEDDGKVAYAYLKEAGAIVGDLWLYNRCLTPQDPGWHDRTRIPFALSRDFVADGARLTRPVGSADVRVKWHYEGDVPVAYIYVFEDLLGVVGHGDKPGYARHAVVDSRLARVMQIDEPAG